jgi:hypothetical protein
MNQSEIEISAQTEQDSLLCAVVRSGKAKLPLVISRDHWGHLSWIRYSPENVPLREAFPGNRWEKIIIDLEKVPQQIHFIQVLILYREKEPLFSTSFHISSNTMIPTEITNMGILHLERSGNGWKMITSPVPEWQKFSSVVRQSSR